MSNKTTRFSQANTRRGNVANKSASRKARAAAIDRDVSRNLTTYSQAAHAARVASTEV